MAKFRPPPPPTLERKAVTLEQQTSSGLFLHIKSVILSLPHLSLLPSLHSCSSSSITKFSIFIHPSSSFAQCPPPRPLGAGRVPPDDVALHAGRQVGVWDSTEPTLSCCSTSALPSRCRFGDPVTVNCSVHQTGFLILGWDVLLVRKAVVQETKDQTW